MSFVPLGLRSSLKSSPLIHSIRPSRSIHTPSSSPLARLIRSKQADSIALTIARSRQHASRSSSRSIFYALGLGSTFVAYQTFQRPSAQCQVAPVAASGNGAAANDYPPPPQSMLSLGELGFGTIAGVCAGVFLKKGLRAIAFLLGGAFIFLQVSLVFCLYLSIG